MSILEQFTLLRDTAKQHGLTEALSILDEKIADLETQERNDERRLRRVVFSGKAIQGMITTGTVIHMAPTMETRPAECVDGLPLDAEYVGITIDPYHTDRLLLYFRSPSWPSVAEDSEAPDMYIGMRDFG